MVRVRLGWFRVRVRVPYPSPSPIPIPIPSPSPHLTKAWTAYYREHNPLEYEALVKLPEQQRSIYYMLFGFIATKGAQNHHPQP